MLDFDKTDRVLTFLDAKMESQMGGPEQLVMKPRTVTVKNEDWVETEKVLYLKAHNQENMVALGIPWSHVIEVKVVTRELKVEPGYA